MIGFVREVLTHYNQSYRQALQSDSLEQFPAGVEAIEEQNTLRIVGSPTLLFAGALLAQAAREAIMLARSQGQADLADEQHRVLMEALETALSRIEEQSVELEPGSDQLYQLALKRLEQKVGGDPSSQGSKGTEV
jgi:hypothetical protein